MFFEKLLCSINLVLYTHIIIIIIIYHNHIISKIIIWLFLVWKKRFSHSYQLFDPLSRGLQLNVNMDHCED